MSPLCPQASSGHSLGTCAGIGVGVGVGGLLMVVGLALLLRGYRRVRQRHALEHGALTEQLLATEQQCMELEMEGPYACHYLLLRSHISAFACSFN